MILRTGNSTKQNTNTIVIFRAAERNGKVLQQKNVAATYFRGFSVFYMSQMSINPSKMKLRPLYLKTQSVPRCKHFSSQL